MVLSLETGLAQRTQQRADLVVHVRHGAVIRATRGRHLLCVGRLLAEPDHVAHAS